MEESFLMNKQVVQVLPVSTRIDNALRLGSIFTIKDLISKRSRELLRLNNFGQESLLEIKECLSKVGLCLLDQKLKEDDLHIKPEVSVAAQKYYHLPLGQCISFHHDTEIERVPGGWIHATKYAGGLIKTFIPYSEEFIYSANNKEDAASS